MGGGDQNGAFSGLITRDPGTSNQRSPSSRPARGTQAFIGNNTYTGGTTVNGGTLLVLGSDGGEVLALAPARFW